MRAIAMPVAGFPTARLPSLDGGPPVEVWLIAQLGTGAGDRLFADACGRQRGHASFVDALDEPSALLGAPHPGAGDASTLFSFAVDRQGHPFHRHAGRRVFTAVAGSGGALLRFSTVPDARLAADPAAFAEALHCVEIPPDALFAVRFGGGAWHQFAPRREGHPVFFALSCHPDELGGLDDPALRARVLAGQADIPALTELLPETVRAWLAADPSALDAAPVTRLSLGAAGGGWRDRAGGLLRRAGGRLRGLRRHAPGFAAVQAGELSHQDRIPADSLLAAELAQPRFHHEDRVAMRLPAGSMRGDADALLRRVLAGFLHNRPASVSRLMRLRNLLVRPLRLRTSPLGCPVSSLLSGERDRLYAGRFPVLAQRIGARRAEVLLGADDRHLAFRSSVDVRIGDDGAIEVGLGTRVRCRNAFGRFYLAAISAVHRRHIAPTMLRLAVASALAPAAGEADADAAAAVTPALPRAA
ncbi:DUF2867 domain-containing protein [Luteimonas sp. Y-2-2-4F]|nr:DUF2867 domain-containing protein [Luteimonas sp. Y-2-2-4F]MCD9033904.1 DUF2867 domain-containing protein [Luteimonas sp. Y-2-2-4F]